MAPLCPKGMKYIKSIMKMLALVQKGYLTFLKTGKNMHLCHLGISIQITLMNRN